MLSTIRFCLKSILAIIILIVITVMLFAFYLYFMLIYTLDGKDYKRSNVFDYYLLTPKLFRDAPDISKNILYYTRADDNYGFTQERVTWENVGDIMVAKKKVENFLSENGIKNGELNSMGETYSIVLEDDDITLVLITCTRYC
ncbi:hypothetical protein [Rahnella selenatireducens]|uniref:hypothetical protein n=1 Tax=Rahnella selenatireducens TaxID=3389797 RepID=UPI0039681BE5